MASIASRVRALGVGLLAALAASAAAADPADFYAGKRLTIVVGYGVGGGYDQYARLFAHYLPDHLPGKPAVIVDNMPGAGSRRAANWLYNAAPKDGTVIASLGQNTPTDQALDAQGIQFDVRRLNWIGNMLIGNNTLAVWHTTGVRTIADATRKEIAIGATGANSTSVLYPQVANNMLGTKLKIISGYRGGGDINLAMERGEVQGRGSNAWASWKSIKPDWVREGKINILFQIGLKREPDLAEVPLLAELAGDEDKRAVLRLISGEVAMGRPIVAPPGVPDARIAALRKAFDETVADPRFVAEAEQRKMDLSPIGGAELQQIAGGIVGASPHTIARMKQAITVKDVKALPADQRKGRAETSE
ncbi:MAG TPA: tripartite tricarboxylate transporter substrate-binding protein [Alphaproteobacteria bacterium]